MDTWVYVSCVRDGAGGVDCRCSKNLSCKEKKVTDPTDYQQKLAEAIWDASRGVNGGVPEIIESFAAALSSEGVVDPTEFMQAQRHISRCHEQINEQVAEVERLKADRDTLRGFIAKHNWQHTPDATEYEALTSGIEDRSDE